MGNFTCSCLPGFEGSGVNCTDIDECLLEDQCHSNAICNNTIPFFTCECKPGYHGNGSNCKGKYKISTHPVIHSIKIKGVLILGLKSVKLWQNNFFEINFCGLFSMLLLD